MRFEKTIRIFPGCYNSFMLPMSLSRSAYNRLVPALVLAALACVHCSGGNDPMAKGQNPSASNPARLSSSQMSALISDVTGDYAQVTPDQKPGALLKQVQDAIDLAKKDPKLSFVKNEKLRHHLSSQFTKNELVVGSDSLRSRFIKQKPEEAASGDASVVVIYLILKYSGADVGSFAEYYVRGAAANYITGYYKVDVVADGDGLVSRYLVDGKALTLRRFDAVHGSGSSDDDSGDDNEANNDDSDSNSGIASGNRGQPNLRSNYLKFIHSGAALAHFRTVSGHSLIGYWDGTTLRRADTFHLDMEKKEINGLNIAMGSDSTQKEQVQFIEIVELRNPAQSGAEDMYDPAPGLIMSAMEAAGGVLSSLGIPHFLLILIPLIAAALILLGKREFQKLEKLLKKVVAYFEGRDTDDGSDAHEGSAYKRALHHILDNDYTEALPVLEKLVAEDEHDLASVALLLELYLFLGEISRFTMTYNSHKRAVDGVAHGALTRYLQILRDYQNSDYGRMQDGIAAFKTLVDPAALAWNFAPLQSFLNLRPNSLHKNELTALLAWIGSHQKVPTK